MVSEYLVLNKIRHFKRRVQSNFQLILNYFHIIICYAVAERMHAVGNATGRLGTKKTIVLATLTALFG